jgi:signal transduction histidine kinase
MILCTEELAHRPARRPDYERENRALAALVKALADSPRTILQTLADSILEALNAGSAGVSLLTTEDGGKRFYWPAIAGTWKPHIGGGTPRDFGPCGDVLDRNAPLLMRHIERRYTYFLPVTPLVEECLLVPFYIEGEAVGTIWAVAHDEERKFDAQDLRQLESLGRFASAAYQARALLGAAEKREEALCQNETQLAGRMAELKKATVESRQARSAAINLMQDAVMSRQAVEKLNVELRESEQRYRTLFDLGPVAVYSIDLSGTIQNFNRRAAELWGRRPASGDTDERFCGSFKLFRPDGSFMPHEDCPMAEVVSGKIPAAHDAEVTIERSDGTRVTVIVNIRPLTNERGQITGAINCFYDITERKQTEEALRRAHELITNKAAHLDALVKERTAKLQETIDELEHFSYTITHDMRAPLRAMQGFAGMLSSEVSDKVSPEADDYLRRITEAANRMDALIRDSLQYAKVIRERTPLTSVHPAPILRGILDSYPALQPRHVQIQLVEPFPPVMANEAGLAQCFSNLLVNAVKFVRAGVSPKIRIWAEVRKHSRPSTVRFWFEDNGIGIPQEYHERIFSMFQQLDKSYEGTGIGLALVRKTANRMNGKAGVESEPGKGSRFWLEFPTASHA